MALFSARWAGWRECNAWLCCAAVALLGGCGQALDKAVVQGQVTFNGKKVLNGDIRFVPEAGTSGGSATAPIVDGEYRVTNKGGVPVGSHRVILRAFVLEDVGSALGGEGGGDLMETAAARPKSKPSMPVYRFEGRLQFLPPEYNERAGLVIEVLGDTSPQIENFHLRGAEK